MSGCTGSAASGDGAALGPSLTGEDGSALALSWTGLAAAVVVLVLVVDLSAYLVAWRRAQGAADAAALAAVAVSDPRGGLPGDPTAAARRVVVAQGGDLRACRCPSGARVVEVSVGVPVRAIAVTRFAGRTATATASAHLVRDDPHRSGLGAGTRAWR